MVPAPSSFPPQNSSYHGGKRQTCCKGPYSKNMLRRTGWKVIRLTS